MCGLPHLRARVTLAGRLTFSLVNTPGMVNPPTRVEAGVHMKAVLTWLNTAFLPISRSRFKQA